MCRVPMRSGDDNQVALRILGSEANKPVLPSHHKKKSAQTSFSTAVPIASAAPRDNTPVHRSVPPASTCHSAITSATLSNPNPSVPRFWLGKAGQTTLGKNKENGGAVFHEVSGRASLKDRGGGGSSSAQEILG